MGLDKIPGERANTSIYVLENQIYHVVSNNCKMFRCKKKGFCSCVLKFQNGQRVQCNDHLHPPQPFAKEIALMTKEMHEMGQKYLEYDPHDIYKQVCKR